MNTGPQPHGAPPLRHVPDHAALRALTGEDPWVRWAVPTPLRDRALTTGRAVAVELRDHRHGWWLWPLPSAAQPERALTEAVEALHEAGLLATAESLSVPRRWTAVRDRLVTVGDGGEWEWMWTCTAPPPVPREQDLVELSDQDDTEEIMAFARTHNPRSWAAAGSGRTELWLGVRDPVGQLRAVGGMERLATGAPHLTGIVTGAGERGRGLGRLVTTALTRRAVATWGVCTLGVYADNTAAIALYRRVGFRTAHIWSSRLLAAVSSGGG